MRSIGRCESPLRSSAALVSADCSDVCRLKIHLHRWIIIKACYYIRNMKLKRPSSANDFEMEGDGGVSTESRSHMTFPSRYDVLIQEQSQHGTPQSLSPPQPEASSADLEVKPIPNLKKRKSSAYLGGGSMSDGEEHSASPAKRPYSTLPMERRSASPRKSLKSFGASSPSSTENIPPLAVRPFDQRPHVSPAGGEPARVQLGPLSSNDVNGSGAPVTAPAPAGGFAAVNHSFTAVNTPPPTVTAPPPPMVREQSNEMSRAPSLDSKMTSPAPVRVEPRAAYTSPYDTAAQGSNMPSMTPDPRTLPVISSTPVPGQAFHPVNSPTPTNGVASRETSVARAPHQSHFGSATQATPPLQPQPQPQSSPPNHAAQLKARPELTPSRTHVPLHQQSAQPPSRTETPGSHHVSRSIAPHPSSRSNTPFAQESNGQSVKPHSQQIAPAQAPGPAELHAPIHGMRIVPAVVPTGHAPPVQPPPPVAAPAQPPQAVLKSQHVEVPPPHQARPAMPVVELRLLQCEVLALLIQYLFPRPASPPDERVVVSQIQNLWYLGEAMFRAELGPHYEMCSRILHAWLHERQSITNLRHSLITQPGVNAAGIMDRLLAMNDLRVMRLKWKNMSPLDGASPEDLLCKTFALISNTENTEHLFKDGLDRLNRGVFEFLRNEDTKIVMQRR